MKLLKRIIGIALCICILTAAAGCKEDDAIENAGKSPNAPATSSSDSKNLADIPEKPAFEQISATKSRTGDKVGFQLEPPAKGETIAVLQTNMGDIKIRLFPDSAPIAVTNFKALIENGYYDGVIFHRVIKDFMIQGGDPQGNGTGGKSVWGNGFEYEFNANLLHFTGALSMAHSSMPNSNGSQFFIVNAPSVSKDTMEMNGYAQYYSDEALKLYEEHGGTYHLDGLVNSSGHAVFGQVFDGMDVVDKISNTATGANDRPLENVVIEKAYLAEFE